MAAHQRHIYIQHVRQQVHDILDKSNTKFSNILSPMEELNTMENISSLGARNDMSGYWWPPTYSISTPTINSFSSSLSAQLTIFSRFLGPELPKPFWALMVQVDIGGHPPIPFETPPSVLSVFQFQHNLLFLAGFRVLNFWSCLEACWSRRILVATHLYHLNPHHQ